jgi:hypothetical protein
MLHITSANAVNILFWSLGLTWFTEAIELLYDLYVTQLPRNHGVRHGSSLYWTKIPAHTLLTPPSYREIIRSSTQRSTCNSWPGSSPAPHQLSFSSSSQKELKVPRTETKSRTATGCLPVARRIMVSSTKWQVYCELRGKYHFSQSTCYTKSFSRCAITKYSYHVKFDFTTLLTVPGLTPVL